MSAERQTIRNHFVPQFATRPWLLRGAYFIRLSASDGAVEAVRSGPKSFGSEENLYSQAIEDAFGDIEYRMAPIQRKLERGEALSPDQRNGWAMWLLVSYLRTPLAILHSANANQAVGLFRGDFFRVGNSRLVSLVANPNCIKLIADRHWEVLISHDPIWLKPDKGVVLTDRLDAEGCLVVYPLSPFACLVAGGRGPSYHASGVSSRRAAGLNRQILRWAERSVVCTATLWNDRRRNLEKAVGDYLGKGEYSHPTGGRFFAPEGLDLGSSLELMLLAPHGPVIMTVPKDAIRNLPHSQPKIPGLYDVDKLPELTLKVRLSDDESEIHFTSAAIIMCEHGRTDLALEYAKKALALNPQDLTAKLIILQHEPTASVGELSPQTPLDAADLALWLARVRRVPLEGLKVTASWLTRFPESEPLVGANFLCAFMVYGHRLFELMLGRDGETSLPYIEDAMPLPEGIIELIKRVYQSGKGGLVENIQGSLADMDHRETGLAADILRLCGCNARLRFYRNPAEAPG
jgi:hypothetical protein